MLNTIKYLGEYVNISSWIVIAIIVVLLAMQGIGEILEFCGKAAPWFMKLRKRWTIRKQNKENDRKTMEEAKAALQENSQYFKEVRSHYNSDNIAKRDAWMKGVNDGLAENRENIRKLSDKVEVISEITLSTHIENQRNTILGFAEKVANGECLATHEQFRRVMAVYQDYENTLKKYNKENGQVDIAYRIITEEYEKRLRNHGFIEDMRWQ